MIGGSVEFVMLGETIVLFESLVVPFCDDEEFEPVVLSLCFCGVVSFLEVSFEEGVVVLVVVVLSTGGMGGLTGGVVGVVVLVVVFFVGIVILPDRQMERVW